MEIIRVVSRTLISYADGVVKFLVIFSPSDRFGAAFAVKAVVSYGVGLAVKADVATFCDVGAKALYGKT